MVTCIPDSFTNILSDHKQVTCWSTDWMESQGHLMPSSKNASFVLRGTHLIQWDFTLHGGQELILGRSTPFYATEDVQESHLNMTLFVPPIL